MAAGGSGWNWVAPAVTAAALAAAAAVVAATACWLALCRLAAWRRRRTRVAGDFSPPDHDQGGGSIIQTLFNNVLKCYFVKYTQGSSMNKFPCVRGAGGRPPAAGGRVGDTRPDSHPWLLFLERRERAHALATPCAPPPTPPRGAAGSELQRTRGGGLHAGAVTHVAAALRPELSTCTSFASCGRRFSNTSFRWPIARCSAYLRTHAGASRQGWGGVGWVGWGGWGGHA
jgi:hypothetical protein